MKSGSHYDVAVIGAGVFGAWIARQLIRDGRKVALFDAYGAANSRASSGGESRIVRVGYGADEFYSHWAQRSLEKWRELAESVDASLFHPTGVLWLSREGDSHGSHTIETLRKLGVSFEALSRNQLQDRYSQIDFGDIDIGILERESGVVMARRAVQTLLVETIKQGLDYQVEAVQASDRKGTLSELRTRSGGIIQAGIFVFACGAWLPKVFPELLEERIRPSRQEVFFFGPPPGDQRFAAPAMPAWIDFGTETYGVPDLENRGFKIAFDRHGTSIDPDRDERRVTDSLLSTTRKVMSRRFPVMKDAPLIEARVCQYENTSNGDFLIDRHPDLTNVWIVGGGSGHGFKHGPMVGDYVSARIHDDGPVETRFTLATKGKLPQRRVY